MKNVVRLQQVVVEAEALAVRELRFQVWKLPVDDVDVRIVPVHAELEREHGQMLERGSHVGRLVTIGSEPGLVSRTKLLNPPVFVAEPALGNLLCQRRAGQ